MSLLPSIVKSTLLVSITASVITLSSTPAHAMCAIDEICIPQLPRPRPRPVPQPEPRPGCGAFSRVTSTQDGFGNSTLGARFFAQGTVSGDASVLRNGLHLDVHGTALGQSRELFYFDIAGTGGSAPSSSVGVRVAGQTVGVPAGGFSWPIHIWSVAGSYPLQWGPFSLTFGGNVSLDGVVGVAIVEDVNATLSNGMVAPNASVSATGVGSISAELLGFGFGASLRSNIQALGLSLPLQASAARVSASTVDTMLGFRLDVSALAGLISAELFARVLFGYVPLATINLASWAAPILYNIPFNGVAQSFCVQ